MLTTLNWFLFSNTGCDWSAYIPTDPSKWLQSPLSRTESDKDKLNLAKVIIINLDFMFILSDFKLGFPSQIQR